MITISAHSGAGGEWTLSSGGLPRLIRCRARLVWRFAGETPWRDEFLSLPAVDGKSFRFHLRAAAAVIDLAGNTESDGGWEFSGRIANTSGRKIELLRFHYLDGAIEESAAVRMLLLQSQSGGAFCSRPGEETPPIRNPKDKPDACSRLSILDTRLPDPIYDAPNWLCAVDSGIFLRDLGGPGWVLGATGPGKAFGEIGLRSAGPDAGHFFAGQLLDNILLAPGEERELERLLILAGDWQEGLRAWATACAQALGPVSTRPPLAGFCSWYRNFAEITAADIDRAVEEFAPMPVPPGGRMIQIDDGFQRAAGDWRVNARFQSDWWRKLPGRIAASGSIPALWLAPLTVQDNHPVAQRHPDWFYRLPDGRFAIAMMNWGWCVDPNWRFAEPGGSLAYNLDPDQPGAREFIRTFLQELVAEGWRAFKLDFNACCPSARTAYDRRKTTFETLRGQYRLFREAVGPDIPLNACVGGPCRYTIGYADSARVDTDMIGDWATICTVLPRLLIRMLATNGIWWSADPDVFYMREKNSVITGSYFDAVTLSKSEEEQSLLLTATGLLGGMMYTSDLPSEWSAEARRKVLEFWGGDRPCPAANPRLAFDPQTGLLIACKVERMVNGRRRIQCALFNLSDEPRVLRIGLSDLGLDPDRDWSLVCPEGNICLRDTSLFSTQPSHSARVATLGEADA